MSTSVLSSRMMVFVQTVRAITYVREVSSEWQWTKYVSLKTQPYLSNRLYVSKIATCFDIYMYM
jgi:hypothetical protein